MKSIDYHIHSNVSQDCKTTMDAMLKRAHELRLDEICFTQHFEPRPKENTSLRPFRGLTLETIDEYKRQVEKGRVDYPNISIKFGLEAGYYETAHEETRIMIEKGNFDFVLGSIHGIEKLGYDATIDKTAFDDRLSKKDIIDIYFNMLHKSIIFGVYDSIAHIYSTLINEWNPSYGSISFNELSERAPETIKLILEKDLAVEVNTADIATNGEPLPGYKFMKIAHEMGLRKITIGSDAHKPESLAMNISSVIMHLKDIGFEQILTYNRRKPIPIEI